MASLSTEAHGGRQVQFVDMDGKRRSIRLGKIPIKQAEAILVRIESLVSAKAGNGAPDPQTAAWLKGIGSTLYDRLARAGLVASRSDEDVTLGAFIARHLASLSVKASTAQTYRTNLANIKNHFGERRMVRSITTEQAEGLKRAMREKGLAQATVSKIIKVARQLFGRAVRLGIIIRNPFAEVVAGSQTNAARLRFVTRDEIQRVLDACPDLEWKLLVALSRFGGLRCPSEPMALRWEDIDWKRNRILIHASKTEGHANRETRMIPLFPEIETFLRPLHRTSGQPTEFVFSTRYRRAGVNVGTQFKRIIRRAGLEPWPRVWHNLRASAQTELSERFPLHVVCYWLGNTVTIASQHYLSVRDSDFTAAVLPVGTASEKAVQNPVQHLAEIAGMDSQGVVDQKRQVPVLQALANTDEILRTVRMTPMGFEPMFLP